MAGGGGGDGGYEQRQRATERKKDRARQNLNALFGHEMAPITYDPYEGTSMLGRLIHGTASAAGGSAVDLPTDAPATQGDQNQVRANRVARDTLYGTVRENAFNSGKRRLEEDFEDAGRQNKFELFARGLAGGSEDIDQNARLKRTYSQGIMDLGAKADAAKAQFRGDDESTRLQLLQSIDAGMDEGSALSSAAQRMQVAADRAAADAQGTALGNVFDTAGLLYQQSQASKGRQAATEWWNEMRPGGKSGAGSKTGVTTRLPGE